MTPCMLCSVRALAQALKTADHLASIMRSSFAFAIGASPRHLDAHLDAQPAADHGPDGRRRQRRAEVLAQVARAVGTGLAIDGGYVDTWSDKENVLWRARVPGRGHSSPIVWDDRIFLTTAYNDGRAAMLAFQRSDGKQLWEAFVPDRTPEYLHPKNSNASATATTDGTRIYAFFGNKGVMAVDFNGRILWHRSLGRFDNYHGTAGSPLLYKDRLILFQDHATGGFVDGARRRRRQAALAHAAPRLGRLEHACRAPRVRPRRGHRQQPGQRRRVRSRHRRDALERARQHLRSHPDAGRRPRPGVLLLGTRGSDAGDQARRHRRCHADRTSPGKARADRRSCPRRSSTATTSTS